MFSLFFQRSNCLNLTSTNIQSIPLLNEPTNSPVALNCSSNSLNCPSSNDSLRNINSTSEAISYLALSNNIQQSSEILNNVEKHLDFSKPIFSILSNIITHQLKFPQSEQYQLDPFIFKKILEEFISIAEDILSYGKKLPHLIMLQNDELYDGMKLHLPHTPPIIAIRKPALEEQAQFWKYLFQEPQTVVDLSNSNESYMPTTSQDFLIHDSENHTIKIQEERRVSITPKIQGSSSHQILELTSTTGFPKVIDRIHFNKWADFRTISIEALQNLAKETIKIAHSKYSGQLIVHCQGGVGRTGTFITYLSVREQIKYMLKNNLSVSGAEIIRLISVTNILGKVYRDISFVENPNQLELVFAAIINDVIYHKEILKEEALLES